MHQKRNGKRDRKFSKKEKTDRRVEEVTGIVSMTREGYGFLIREGIKEDIFINSANCGERFTATK